MKYTAWPILLMFLNSSHVHATVDELTPQGFAYGIELQLTEGKALYDLPLPAAVYRTAVYPDLADMRVFNSNAEPVPHTLLAPSFFDRDLAPDADYLRRQLRWFPVPDVPPATPRDNTLRIELDESGQIVTLSGSQAVSSERVAYILDISQIKQPIASLELQVSGPLTFVERISVEGSDDLHRWRPVLTSTTIARLQHGDEQLERLVIALPAVSVSQRGQYLRLRWQGDSELTLEQVHARVRRDARPAPAAIDNWLTLTGTPDPDNPAAVLYDSGGVFPVQRFNLLLPDSNTLTQARIESRAQAPTANEAAGWRRHAQEKVYHLRFDDLVMTNEDYPITTQAQRYWRVVFADPAVARQLPELKLGWQPHTLRFLARGTAPFVLAYGRAATDVNSNRPVWSDVTLPVSKPMLGAAHAGAAVTLGGDSRLQPSAPGMDWKQISLWSVLLLAVAGLGVMALRLFREMNAGVD